MGKIDLSAILSQANEQNHSGHDVALSFLRTISTDFGVYVKPSFLPKIFHFGEDNEEMTHSMVSRVIAPDFDCPEEFIHGLKQGDIPLDCEKYLSQGYFTSLASGFIDHEKTLKSLIQKNIVSQQDSFPGIIQYLSYLRNAGVLFKEDEWKNEIPQRYSTFTPEQDIAMHVASGKHVAACPPGWTDNIKHSGRSIYRLSNVWYDDSKLSEKIELYSAAGKFKLTHGICPDCEKSLEKEMLK